MEYGRCQNGMEDFKNVIEDNLPYIHTNSMIDFVHAVFTKNIKEWWYTPYKSVLPKCLTANHLLTNTSNSVVCIPQTVLVLIISYRQLFRHVVDSMLLEFIFNWTIRIISCNIVITLYFGKKIVSWSGYFAILCLSTLMFIPVVLAILTRNKRRMSIPKQCVLGC